jgi:hypothetical protein
MSQPETQSTQLFQRKRKQLRGSSIRDGQLFAQRAQRRRIFSSWEDEFFEGTEDVWGVQKFWTPNVEQDHLQFQYKELRFVRLLNEVLRDAPAQVWLVQADSERYATKLVTLNL